MNDKQPRYELQRVYDDGTSTPPEITPVEDVPMNRGLERRTLFGSVLATGAALLGFCGDAEAASSKEKKCKKKKGYKWDKKKKKCVKKKKKSGSSYTICTCNKVCTCVPVYDW